uniref:Uncharacterized protein n=1 Tax=Dunaliella tertiolecta TaxID=3047 RepID=A0A7S3VLW8_DUNTE
MLAIAATYRETISQNKALLKIASISLSTPSLSPPFSPCINTSVHDLGTHRPQLQPYICSDTCTDTYAHASKKRVYTHMYTCTRMRAKHTHTHTHTSMTKFLHAARNDNIQSREQLMRMQRSNHGRGTTIVWLSGGVSGRATCTLEAPLAFQIEPGKPGKLSLVCL